ncbi:hypothetical protein BCR44DRAFT_42505, partial [Catenaria anguillulae PL171]
MFTQSIRSLARLVPSAAAFGPIRHHAAMRPAFRRTVMSKTAQTNVTAHRTTSPPHPPAAADPAIGAASSPPPQEPTDDYFFVFVWCFFLYMFLTLHGNVSDTARNTKDINNSLKEIKIQLEEMAKAEKERQRR